MKVLIFGATGMVGSEVLKNCIETPLITSILSVGRRKTGIKCDKLKEIILSNFKDINDLKNKLQDFEICFYCLGVYQNSVSKKVFWEITVKYLEDLIEFLPKKITFCLFSAQGADPKERIPILFSKAKGRAEKLLLNSSIQKKYIFRPGHIKPSNVKYENTLSRILNPFYYVLPFIGIDADKFAKLMVFISLNGKNNIIFENHEMRRLIKIFNL